MTATSSKTLVMVVAVALQVFSAALTLFLPRLRIKVEMAYTDGVGAIGVIAAVEGESKGTEAS